jgi:hypothetical protein
MIYVIGGDRNDIFNPARPLGGKGKQSAQNDQATICRKRLSIGHVNGIVALSFTTPSESDHRGANSRQMPRITSFPETAIAPEISNSFCFANFQEPVLDLS